jgi:hypothetical protein
MQRLSAEIDRPVSLALIQVDADPNLWREQLDISAAAVDAGSRLHPQIAARPFGMLLGFPGHHAFTHRPTYRRLKSIAAARNWRDVSVSRRRKPRSSRRTICPIDPTLQFDAMFALVQHSLHRLYALGDPPDYEPTLTAPLLPSPPGAARIRWPRCMT